MQNNPTRQYKPRGHLRCGLLATLLMTTALTWPGGPAHAQCVTTGTTANCTGDLSAGVTDGVDFNAPPVDTINIFDVTGNITPAAGDNGVFAETIGADKSLTISVDTAPFEIITQGDGASGIFARTVGTNSTIALTNEGAVSTQGDFSLGMFVEADGDFSDVEVTNRGAISTEGGFARGIVAATGSQFGGTGEKSSITLTNWGRIDTLGAFSTGIDTLTEGDDSDITIANHGAISTANDDAIGIVALSEGPDSAITISNWGAINTRGNRAIGIFAETDGVNSAITIDNRAAIATTDDGMDIDTDGDNSAVAITNLGTITTQGSSAHGLTVKTDGVNNDVTIDNRAAISTDGVSSEAIFVDVTNDDSSVTIANQGAITTLEDDAMGIFATTSGANSAIALINEAVVSTLGIRALGISAGGNGDFSNVDVTNRGAVSTGGDRARGISTNTGGDFSNVEVTNWGRIDTKGNHASGLRAGASGDHSTVEITNRGAVNTEGDSAFGINAATGNSFLGTGRDSTIALTNWGQIDTLGEDAIGINALTLGDNANIAIKNMGIITTQRDGAVGISAETRGAGSGIDITNSAEISTQGNNAAGISAASSAGAVSVTSTANISTKGGGQFSSAILALSGGGPGAPGGPVSVMSKGTLTTIGSDTFGIFALSRFGDGAVSAFSEGNIIVEGERSSGIVAQATGNDTTVTSVGDIMIGGDDGDGIRTFSAAGFSSTVNVMEGTVAGGSGDGAGVAFVGTAGTTNTLNINGPVTLSALSGTAVSSRDGDTTINNRGILNTVTDGAIVLGAGTNAFNNRLGGVFNAGGRVDLGAGNLFTNDGIFSPGGLGNIATTNVTGHFIQSDTGILAIDVRIGTPGADLADINGEADLSGLVVPTIVDPQVVRSGTLPQVTILTADRVTNNGIMAQDTAIIDYELLFPDANTVALGATVDFIPAGLNANQTAVAQTVNAIQTAGGSAALDPAVGGLLAAPNLDSLGNAYDQLGPQIYLANGVATLFSALDFTDELMSCETRDKGNVFIAQDQCVWARVSGNWLDQDDTSQTIGFDRWAARFSGGVQAELAPDWRLGLALGYEHGDLNALGGLQNSTSDSVYGGAAIKYTKGNGLLAAAVSGGHGWYDTTRNLAFGGFGGQATASHDVSHINARLRGAWAFTRDNRYIKPMVDLNLSWIDMGGFTESGGAGLSVEGSQETVWSVTPAVEFGWQRALGDGRLIRPYVRAGVTLLDDPSFTTVSSFTAAPAGTAAFQATMSTDDVIGEIAAGMDVLMTNGAAVKVFYEGRFGETTIQQSGGLKASMKF